MYGKGTKLKCTKWWLFRFSNSSFYHFSWIKANQVDRVLGNWIRQVQEDEESSCALCHDFFRVWERGLLRVVSSSSARADVGLRLVAGFQALWIARRGTHWTLTHGWSRLWADNSLCIKELAQYGLWTHRFVGICIPCDFRSSFWSAQQWAASCCSSVQLCDRQLFLYIFINA